MISHTLQALPKFIFTYLECIAKSTLENATSHVGLALGTTGVAVDLREHEEYGSLKHS